MSAAARGADDAERWLLELENFGIRPGLDRMRALIAALAIPVRPTVHVAGTNGKTSTTLLCAAMLERAGLLTGAYVSPHAESFADRLHVAGRPLEREPFGDLAQAVRVVADALPDPPGQFELLTAIALRAFADAGVDAQVLEAGLGGRLDATNAVASDVQVLTSVGLDHQAWLGEEIEQIAAEKLAIVEPGGILVLAPGLAPSIESIARDVVAERGATIVRATAVPAAALRDPAGAGGFQRQNIGVALAAARALLQRLPALASRPVEDADLIAAAEARLPLRGRLEVLQRNPLVVIDAAHNVQAMQALLRAFTEIAGDAATVAVVAFLAGKDPAGMLAVLAERCRSIVVTTTDNPRAADLREITGAARALGLEVETQPDPRAAIDRARSLAGPEGAVLVTGTTSLIRELRAPGAVSNRSRY